MIMIIKAIGVLFLDIAIYYVIGTAITERFKNRIKRNVAFHIIIGFIVYQIIFQVCAIPFIWLKRSLTELTFDNSHRNCGGGESKETDSRRFLFCEKNIKRTQTAYGYNYNSSPYCMLVYNTEWGIE